MNNLRIAIITIFISVPLMFSLFNKKVEAVEKSSLNIAVVNMEEVFNQYKKTEIKNSKLKKEQEEKQNEGQKMLEEINRMKEEVDLLSEDAKKKKEDEIKEKVMAFRKFSEEAQKDLMGQRNIFMEEILKEIEGIKKDIGKEEGYDFIANEKAFIYYSGNMDITETVIQKLNKQFSNEVAETVKAINR